MSHRPRHFWLMFLLVLSVGGCDRLHDDPCSDYRQAMRGFVVRISETAREANSHFVVITQNGVELVTENGEADGNWASRYLSAIDGVGQEDLFYGYDGDGIATPANETNHLLGFLRRLHTDRKTVLVTDYCTDIQQMATSATRCDEEGFVPYAPPSRELNRIPTTPPLHENNDDITHLNEVRNFLYLINPEGFANKSAFIAAVCATNYDLLIMDLFFDGEAFTAEEIEQLRSKANGGRRMVMSYMSIGEAENYRYYWQSSWKQHRPVWLDKENPDWEGNYKVHYWNSDWQEIICGAGDSYLNRILHAGFDGVYLDIIDAFEYYE